ncbi:calcium/sodium antiporter [Thalassovita sp.]|uniref:calcium/sodium antiporter n=1 Tax=Thalassovita sp. TaxID=1979401 RepID=UPI0029DE8626|nr:calcium/sodium antiporter [Thalassovita sp.]
MLDLLLIAGGFLCLLFGGESLVSGAVSLAQRWKVPPLVIGLTLVGFGTSMPELVTSVQAALKGSPGVAIGNVVGSNIANVLLILGLSALLWPIGVARHSFRRDGAFLLLSALLGAGLILTGQIGAIGGAALLLGLGLFLFAAFHSSDRAEADYATRPVWLASLLFTGGLLLTLLGARWLVSGAIGLASGLGVSESLIGLTIVAIGTSLPELVTSLVAARRQQSDVAFGNIVGSNIFNLFGILGTTALIRPMEVPPAIASLDIWVMLAATLALMAAAVTGQGISRREGGLMLAGYMLYLVVLGSTVL